MRLFEYDAYTSLTRFIPRDEHLVMIDVGANVGDTARRMLEEFPGATVHAFEPAPETFKLLQARVAGNPRIKTYPVACGSSVGSIDFHVTANNWCSSVLPPSDLGKRYYGDWYATKQVVKVPLTTLDRWASEHHINRVDFIKCDAQGFDLEVLKGATGVLQNGVRAINCECQFAPEYEGCATFSQVDRFLAEQGYALHQVHEVWSKGDEEQTSYADALWLRVDVLATLRGRKDLPDLTPKGRVRAALDSAKERGKGTAALFGAGQHTRRLIDSLSQMPIPVAAIIDDNPDNHGKQLGPIPIVSQDRALELGVDVVILSSDAHEAGLWSSSVPLRRAGVEVVPLYKRYAEVN